MDGPVPLVVDPPSPSTYWPKIPITGRGPGHGTLIYTSPATGQQVQELGSDGTFCVDVALAEAAVNKITFEAVGTDGQFSEQIVIEVRQDGTPPDPAPTPGQNPIHDNTAFGATEFAGTIKAADNTSREMLVDNDEDANVVLQNDYWHADWLSIRLSESAPISMIKVITDDDCQLKDYDIWLSDADTDPGRPEQSSNDWVKLIEIRDGDLEQEIFPPIGKPTARYLGIDVRHKGCGKVWEGGKHNVSEIQVWAEVDRDDEDTPPDYPTCASGG